MKDPKRSLSVGYKAEQLPQLIKVSKSLLVRKKIHAKPGVLKPTCPPLSVPKVEIIFFNGLIMKDSP